jgi:hypothetical protein
MRRTASLKYDFETASWIVIADWNNALVGAGTTPQEAMDDLRYDCNKHELWPKESK